MSCSPARGGLAEVASGPNESARSAQRSAGSWASKVSSKRSEMAQTMVRWTPVRASSSPQTARAAAGRVTSPARPSLSAAATDVSVVKSPVAPPIAAERTQARRTMASDAASSASSSAAPIRSARGRA